MTAIASPRGLPDCRQIRTVLALFLVFAMLLSCVGHPLRSNRPRGVYHRVKAGETLSAIARAYQVGLQELAEINNIRDPAQIEVDGVIFIPDAPRIVDVPPLAARLAEAEAAKAAASPKPKPPAPGEKAERAPGERDADREVSPRAPEAPPRAPEAPPREPGAPPREPGAAEAVAKRQMPAAREAPKGAAPGSTDGPPAAVPAPPPPVKRGEGDRQELTFDKRRFGWPVKGKVITQFGMQPNRMYFNGIRIAAPGGTAVLAAASGTVIFSASIKDYGETIIIKHADQYATVYTHLGVRTVGGETRVQRGDRIAFLADGGQGEPFVHFEIRHNNKARNPLFFLP